MRRAVRLVGLVLIVVLCGPAGRRWLLGRRQHLAQDSTPVVYVPVGADPARFRMPVLGQLGDPDELYRVTVVPRRRVRHGR